MIPFGQILQRLRSEKRWSQSKLAEKLGLSASQVANYEMGRRLPSLQILIDMARILGVSTDYLLGVENETKQILSQRQLAKRVGVNASTIALYETGDRLPSLQRLIDLSRALGVTTDFLLGLSKQKDHFLDVSGLSPSQIASLEQIVENYRAQR